MSSGLLRYAQLRLLNASSILWKIYVQLIVRDPAQIEDGIHLIHAPRCPPAHALADARCSAQPELLREVFRVDISLVEKASQP